MGFPPKIKPKGYDYMKKDYSFTKENMNSVWTVEELHKDLAPDMPLENFIQLLVKCNLINEDRTPTQWAIDNGYITSISDEKYLQFMEMSIIFAVPHEALYSLIEHGELVWIEKNKEWAFTKQGLKDIGTISSKKNVQEMSKKFLSNMVA